MDTAKNDLYIYNYNNRLCYDDIFCKYKALLDKKNDDNDNEYIDDIIDDYKDFLDKKINMVKKQYEQLLLLKNYINHINNTNIKSNYLVNNSIKEVERIDSILNFLQTNYLNKLPFSS